MAGGLLFVHLSVPVKVGPSLLVGQNLKKMTGNGDCTFLNLLLLGVDAVGHSEKRNYMSRLNVFLTCQTE